MEMFTYLGLGMPRKLASYIPIAKWKTSSRIRRVEELEEDSDRSHLTSKTVERLAPNFNVTELYKTPKKVELFARDYP